MGQIGGQLGPIKPICRSQAGICGSRGAYWGVIWVLIGKIQWEGPSECKNIQRKSDEVE